MRTEIFQRSDPIWPWGYWIEGHGFFVAGSEEDAKRKVRQWLGANRPQQQV